MNILLACPIVDMLCVWVDAFTYVGVVMIFTEDHGKLSGKIRIQTQIFLEQISEYIDMYISKNTNLYV